MGRSLPIADRFVAALAAVLLIGGLHSRVAAEELPQPRIFQCVLPDGRKVTSDKPIAECSNVGRPQRELNKDGSEKGVVEAPLTEDEKAERDRIRRQREAEKTAYDIEVRRDRELVKRYPNEAAHAKAREKALDDVGTSVRNSEARIKLLLQDRKPLMDEAEFYVGKTVPNKIKLALDANDAALGAQRSLVSNQQTEVVRINALYDVELMRLRKLWAGAPPGSLGPSASAATGSAPPTTTAAAITTAPARRSASSAK